MKNQHNDEVVKIITTIIACARCNKNHLNLEFNKFANFSIADFNFWALCPELNEPVLLNRAETIA